MKNFLIGIGVILVIGFAAFGWYQNGYNKAVQMHEKVGGAWAQVDNQLQRRNDLIPNLVNTVKGYAAQEKEVLIKVTELRSQWGKAATIPEKINQANEISSALSRLLMVSENYPELKSNENFLALQSQLEGTENRIAVERMRYNDTVKEFNTFQREFMGRVFTGWAGITEPAVYFKAEAQAAKVPEVKF